MQINEILLWYHQNHLAPFKKEDIMKHFPVDEKVQIILAPFFDETKEGYQLKKKYHVGIVAVKKHMAFLLQAPQDDIRIDLYNLNGAMDRDLVLINVDAIEPYVVSIIQSHLTKVIAEVKRKKNLIRFD